MGCQIAAIISEHLTGNRKALYQPGSFEHVCVLASSPRLSTDTVDNSIFILTFRTDQILGRILKEISTVNPNHILSLTFLQAARDAPLVDKLRWLLEARFARASAIGARTLTADWSVSMGGLIGALPMLLVDTPQECQEAYSRITTCAYGGGLSKSPALNTNVALRPCYLLLVQRDARSALRINAKQGVGKKRASDTTPAWLAPQETHGRRCCWRRQAAVWRWSPRWRACLPTPSRPSPMLGPSSASTPPPSR